MTKKMNQEIKKRWVEALRSGEYQQGKNVLRDSSNRFCCLGVLCDLTKDELGLKWSLVDKSFFIDKSDTYDDNMITLPSCVSEYTGVGPNGLIHDGDLSNEILAELNDEGYTFSELADIIEENF